MAAKPAGNPARPANSSRDGQEALIVSDAWGAVRFLNQACVSLLQCDIEAAIGLPCWRVARLRYRNGEPFCAPDCPVQRQARASLRLLPQQVVYEPVNGPPVPLEVQTILIPAPPAQRYPLLHEIRLAPAGDAATLQTPPARGQPKGKNNSFSHLSRRERQMLELLAAGHSTTEIAHRLFISPVTVCNHIQRLLRKLNVHSRLDAVLCWLQRPR